MSLTSWNIFGLLVRGAGLYAATALLLAACSEPASRPTTGSLVSGEQSAARERSATAPVDIAPLAAAHKATPADATAALAYARALRASGAKREALAVLDKAAASRPGDRQLQLERGLLALDLGEPAKAEKLLRQAQNLKVPDWRVHSALGAALASRGKQQEAQLQFAKALALAPDHPSVLNNLALSYALDGKATEAEKLLRKAQRSGMPQVQQNLALVVGLAGKYEESRVLAEAALPPAKATENVAYLQRLASARSSASRAESSDPSRAAARNASLPQPSYQLGGPASPERGASK